ncbi:MAG: TonB-dependent receptor [Candidatus Omnitrophica bacterium]|nr:TonB-dependent receptor [Candidatus Omnitrophota bacterium]
MSSRCVLFSVIIFFVIFNPCLGEETSSLGLGPIIITKSKVHLLDSYSITRDAAESLAFNSPIEQLSFLALDLQSRSPQGAIQTDFSLRGSTFQGVLMLLDGARINDPQTGHHNSDLPVTLADIEQIEITPGISSARFGPDAIGGAINITLKKPKREEGILEISYGEFKTNYALLSISEIIGDLGLRFSVENQESDGFYEDTDSEKFTTSLNSFLEIPDGEFKFSFGYQEKEFGAYDFYTPGCGYLSKEWTKTFLLNSGMTLEKGGFLIKPNFLWRRHFDKFALDKTLKRSTYLNHHQTDIYTPNIYIQKYTSSLGKIGLGLEYGEERIKSTNLGDHTRNHRSIFADDAFDLNDRLSFDLSLRTDDFDGFKEVETGSVNCRFKFREGKGLSLGISRSIRVPSFTELYYNDPLTLGNSGLSAEKSKNYQAGYDYERKAFSLGVVFFFRQEEGFIDWVKRSPSQVKWQAENISGADVYGIENYLRFDINDYLKLNTNYTYINKCNDDDVYLYKYGSNYIKHLVNSVLIFDLPFGVQSIGLTYKKKPSRDGWLLVSTRLAYDFNKNFQIFLKGTNLFNVEYQEIEGIPQPGRYLEAGLRLSW